jgi:hypothetical protein
VAEWLLREAPVEVVGHDVDGRTVTVRLCRWNDPRVVVDPDGTSYREQYPPGTIAGNDTLALIDAGVTRSVSMEIEAVDAADAGGILTRTRSIVHGLAFAFRPAHDSPILAVRENPTPGVTIMPITDTPTLEPPDVDTPPPAGDVLTVDVLNRELDIVRRDIIAHTAGTDTGHPLARFRSLADAFAEAHVVPETHGLLKRALADQITTNNPGVMPPSWLSTVFGIIERGRPTISAFGVESPGPSGMDVNWPYFDGDIKTLVAKQTAEKAAITSVRVDLKKGTKTLETYAGGSDVSYQLLKRSDPSYRDAYLRIMYNAYAAVTDVAAAAALIGGIGLVYDVATDTTGSALRSALFAASVAVQAATGQPAAFALAATDVFVKIGGMGTLFPVAYGTTNVSGTADAASLRVNVNGIEVIHDPYLPTGELFVSNPEAASWFEDGPAAVEAEDVEKLGRNIAVWGLGAFAIHLPKGIVQLNATGVPALMSDDDNGGTRSSKKS